MGVADPAATSGSRDQPVAESLVATPCNTASFLGLRGASSVSAAARVQIIEGLLDQPVKPPRCFVLGNLTIPRSSIKFCVPCAKRRHLIGRELLDSSFDFFDCTHELQYIP